MGALILLLVAVHTAWSPLGNKVDFVTVDHVHPVSASDIDQLIHRAAERYGLDPYLLKGLLWSESRLNPRMRSRSGVGIASFTPAGIRGLNFIRVRAARRARRPPEPVFTEAGAMDPTTAIPASAELLAWYIARFGRDAGISGYNGGFQHARAVARYGYREAFRRGLLFRCGRVPMTGRYLPQVLAAANRFRTEAGLPPLSPPG